MKKVVVRISEDGLVKLDFLGFKGKTCDLAEDKLIKLLTDLQLKTQSERYKTVDETEKEMVSW